MSAPVRSDFGCNHADRCRMLAEKGTAVSPGQHGIGGFDVRHPSCRLETVPKPAMKASGSTMRLYEAHPPSPFIGSSSEHVSRLRGASAMIQVTSVRATEHDGATKVPLRVITAQVVCHRPRSCAQISRRCRPLLLPEWTAPRWVERSSISLIGKHGLSETADLREAGQFPRGPAGRGQGREQDAHQQCDDADDHQQLDQGECRFLGRFEVSWGLTVG